MRAKLMTIASMAIIISLTACNSGKQENEQASEVDFTKIHLNDPFWAERIETNRTVTIPAALHECEVNGRFRNFAKAAGLYDGPHEGDFSFDDTDVYKVVEGASFSLAAHYDAELDERIDSIVHLIALAQEDDGYLTTCVTNKAERLKGWWGDHRWDKINSHELYNCGHLYEAAVAHYQATGKRELLDVAIKNADLICEVFGPNEGQIHRPSGHPIVEMALCKLYLVTGTKKYLDLAKYFVEETGRGTDGHQLSEYSQDHMPILQQDEIKGHAVRAGYLYSGVADVASLTGDKEYFTALERIWNNMAGCKLYITGGIGSRPQGEGFGPNYELHNMENYCETCASIANVYWNHRMFLATGDAKYIDVLERALYNGAMAGVSLDGFHFFYDNPLSSMGQHEREKWFGCACCPGNVTRFVASVPKYMYATANDEIFVNLYIASTSEIALSDNKITLKQETDMPWDGKVALTVSPEKEGKFTLKLRIPGWAHGEPVPTDLYSYMDKGGNYSVAVNGKAVKGKLTKGYVVVNRTWKAGDVVEINLPMDVHRTVANPKVPADVGLVEIERGPIVYCIEGVDNGDTVFDKYIDANQTFTTEWKPELLKGVTVIKGKATKVALDGTETEVDLTAIPYSTWCNRGPDHMEVWMAASKEYAVPTPEPTKASQARAVTIPVPHPDRWGEVVDFRERFGVENMPVWGINDQWEPKSSSDISKPYHYWWLQYGTECNVAYLFDEPTELSSSDVYWLDFDQYDQNFRVPEHYSLSYLASDGKTWVPVETSSDYKVEKDCWNHVDFTTVKTKGIRLDEKLQEGESGGIIEWKVQ